MLQILLFFFSIIDINITHLFWVVVGNYHYVWHCTTDVTHLICVILTSKLPQPVGTRFKALDICHTCILIYPYAWNDHLHLQFDSMSHCVQILCQNSSIVEEASLWSARVIFMLPFRDRKWFSQLLRQNVQARYISHGLWAEIWGRTLQYLSSEAVGK